MKKILLQKITQFESECYVGRINPRDLVRVSTKVEIGEVQDAQRPLSKSRVIEIAKYVGVEKGLLPINLTIATKDTRFTVEKIEKEDLYYLNFPENEEEFENYKDAIDVMDGQHRLYSFLPEHRFINDDAKYEMAFTLYITPTLEEKQRIFISCNEKQQSVSPNLINWFKEKLGLLSSDEQKFYGIVSSLSTSYPLRGHIIMSAEKVQYGVKAIEIMKALRVSNIGKITVNGQYLPDDTIVKILNIYLTAWENVVGFKFYTTSKKANQNAGPAVKMAGLKYMIYLFPAFWDKLIEGKQACNPKNIENLLKDFITMYGVERSKFFTCDKINTYFRDASMVKVLSEDSIAKIKSIGISFNPLVNI